MFYLATTDGRFYTGKAGQDWVSVNRQSAFPFATIGEAQRRADMFNARTALTGLVFYTVD